MHFPVSTHVRLVGLQSVTDDEIWQFARDKDAWPRALVWFRKYLGS